MNSEKYADKTREQRLFHLIEELGELAQAIGKAGRWGLESVNPELPAHRQIENAHWILSEIRDVRETMDAVERDLIDGIAALAARRARETALAAQRAGGFVMSASDDDAETRPA